MYIRFETRHFQCQQFRDSWGSESSSGSRESTGTEGGGEGGGGLGGIGGGQSPSRGGGESGASVSQQYEAYGQGRQIAEAMAGYGPASPVKSDWDRMLENSPSFGTSARLALGVFASPIGGLFNAARYNAERLAGMTEAERNLEKSIRDEMDAARSSLAGNRESAPVQSTNAKRPIFSTGGTGAGKSGFYTGPLASSAEMVGQGSDTQATSGGGTGVNGGLIVAGESPLAKLAALATIGAVIFQFLG